jgi:hypothetical protein
VTPRFDAQGKIYPLRLALEGREYPILDVGRRWEDAAGLHILVMTGEQRVWELMYRLDSARWYVLRPSSRPFA